MRFQLYVSGSRAQRREERGTIRGSNTGHVVVPGRRVDGETRVDAHRPERVDEAIAGVQAVHEVGTNRARRRARLQYVVVRARAVVGVDERVRETDDVSGLLLDE